MKISKDGLEFIKNEEGCVLHPYKDKAGYPTIGIGHLIRKGEHFPAKITLEFALNLLDQDCDIAEEAVNSYIDVELTQAQFDMLVSFTFNCGTGALKNYQLRKLINSHAPIEEIEKDWKTWRKSNGKVDPVLVGRRAREIEIFKNWYK